MNNQIAEVKKMDDGKIAVRYKGQKKFYVVQDDKIAAYIFYTMTIGKEQTIKNINSACR